MAMTEEQMIKDQIEDLRAQVRDASNRDTCRKAARDLRMYYEAFMSEGFSQEESWELMKIIVSKLK